MRRVRPAAGKDGVSGGNAPPLFHISSAGTHAYNGEPINALAVAALRDCGEKLPKTLPVSTPMTRQMINDYDHIVCMENAHKEMIDPYDEHPNVYTLGVDIPDPYGCGADGFLLVCKQLQAELKKLYNAICKT